ncbi:GTP cyclohydrolase FolE2 [Pseudonocardia yunnanensis]|uniref:GTP cyclohydrolase I FolE2 n=1 Tax=Pseudonocardia yunnanensis TaxID=58107 RepID=A0ABW4EVL5_9PSEU
MSLPDIQSGSDFRGIDLDHVGISNLRYPVTFSDGELTQSGVADIEMTVGLPAAHRGTHMSRMVEITHEHLQDLDPRTIGTILKVASTRLDVPTVALQVAMPISAEVQSPVSGATSWQAHDLVVRATLRHSQISVETAIASEVTSVCPCSKAISDYGAHNQRSRITLTTIGEGDWPYPISATESIELIRASGSCPVLPLVKRPDERAVTMRAHDKPMFVEDMARDLSTVIRKRHVSHRIEIRNFESIHSHDAVARLTWRNPASASARHNSS